MNFHPALEIMEGSNAPRARMQAEASRAGLPLRVMQIVFAVAMISVVAIAHEFSSIPTFRFLAAAFGLQCFWSIFMVLMDLYALHSGHKWNTKLVLTLFTVGDGVTFILTLVAVCASAGVAVLIERDRRSCILSVCAQFRVATAVGFIGWSVTVPCFFFSYCSLFSP
ncbi:CASP-like protein 5A2 [Punica granatum]|uniref:CASP-like protein n=1 Tax=Punica granatum TaxID=22663 RepID=A0A6P8E997_PUNGR|nr:CASP-like protein 5A2 [Punica granatum]XP_031403115.1 CASP-like protein 5A2 [Punica granatum]XP_031403116.1 CASP-like protein 5A2 [Punica granatum]